MVQFSVLCLVLRYRLWNGVVLIIGVLFGVVGCRLVQNCVCDRLLFFGQRFLIISFRVLWWCCDSDRLKLVILVMLLIWMWLLKWVIVILQFLLRMVEVGVIVGLVIGRVSEQFFSGYIGRCMFSGVISVGEQLLSVIMKWLVVFSLLLMCMLVMWLLLNFRLVMFWLKWNLMLVFMYICVRWWVNSWQLLVWLCGRCSVLIRLLMWVRVGLVWMMLVWFSILYGMLYWVRILMFCVEVFSCCWVWNNWVVFRLWFLNLMLICVCSLFRQLWLYLDMCIMCVLLIVQCLWVQLCSICYSQWYWVRFMFGLIVSGVCFLNSQLIVFFGMFGVVYGEVQLNDSWLVLVKLVFSVGLGWWLMIVILNLVCCRYQVLVVLIMLLLRIRICMGFF